MASELLRSSHRRHRSESFPATVSVHSSSPSLRESNTFSPSRIHGLSLVAEEEDDGSLSLNQLHSQSGLVQVQPHTSLSPLLQHSTKHHHSQLSKDIEQGQIPIRITYGTLAASDLDIIAALSPPASVDTLANRPNLSLLVAPRKSKSSLRPSTAPSHLSPPLGYKSDAFGRAQPNQSSPYYLDTTTTEYRSTSNVPAGRPRTAPHSGSRHAVPNLNMPAQTPVKIHSPSYRVVGGHDREVFAERAAFFRHVEAMAYKEHPHKTSSSATPSSTSDTGIARSPQYHGLGLGLPISPSTQPPQSDMSLGREAFVRCAERLGTLSAYEKEAALQRELRTASEPALSSLDRYRQPSAQSAKKARKAAFEQRKNALPSIVELHMASNHSIFSEDGRAIDFADIIRANYGGITIVTFVRHMYCGLCQEYLALLNRLEEHTYDKHGVDVIVIGCGDWQLIRAYKAQTKWSGRMYTDPQGVLQDYLGMTWKTLSAGPGSAKGDYQQRNMLWNGLVSAMNGVKMLSKHPRSSPGKFDRLGGEMVFKHDPANDLVTCIYAHRMTTTRSHGPLLAVFQAAGVDVSTQLTAIQKKRDSRRRSAHKQRQQSSDDGKEMKEGYGPSMTPSTPGFSSDAASSPSSIGTPYLGNCNSNDSCKRVQAPATNKLSTDANPLILGSPLKIDPEGAAGMYKRILASYRFPPHCDRPVPVGPASPSIVSLPTTPSSCKDRGTWRSPNYTAESLNSDFSDLSIPELVRASGLTRAGRANEREAIRAGQEAYQEALERLTDAEATAAGNVDSRATDYGWI